MELVPIFRIVELAVLLSHRAFVGLALVYEPLKSVLVGNRFRPIEVYVAINEQSPGVEVERQAVVLSVVFGFVHCRRVELVGGVPRRGESVV